MYDLNYHGTQGAISDQTEPLPDLCHKCGRCCRSATTYNSYKKLLKMAAEGEQEAIDFLEIFEPYESIEAARAVEPDQVDRVLEVAEGRDDMDVDEMTFYHCRYVTPEGLCGIYERRPRCCVEAPGHGWSVMPPGCGFEGWQFEQRENQKALIRQMKSTVFTIKKMSPDGKTHPTRPETTIDEMETALNQKIAPWQQFGAEYW